MATVKNRFFRHYQVAAPSSVLSGTGITGNSSDGDSSVLWSIYWTKQDMVAVIRSLQAQLFCRANTTPEEVGLAVWKGSGVTVAPSYGQILANATDTPPPKARNTMKDSVVEDVRIATTSVGSFTASWPQEPVAVRFGWFAAPGDELDLEIFSDEPNDQPLILEPGDALSIVNWWGFSAGTIAELLVRCVWEERKAA